jgi:hypothetical protein
MNIAHGGILGGSRVGRVRQLTSQFAQCPQDARENNKDEPLGRCPGYRVGRGLALRQRPLDCGAHDRCRDLGDAECTGHSYAMHNSDMRQQTIGRGETQGKRSFAQCVFLSDELRETPGDPHCERALGLTPVAGHGQPHNHRLQ